MQLTLLHGYPDLVGKRAIWCGYGSGPASYLGGVSAGDTITGLPFQFYIDSIFPAVSVSGTYLVVAQRSVEGARATFKLRWFTMVGMTEVTNATDLSAQKVNLSGFGGSY